MKRLAICLVLLVAGSVLGAQEQVPPSNPPPYETPPTFPEQRQAPRQQMPPDTQAPAAEAASAEQVQQQITQHLVSEPTLTGSNLKAQVDEGSVTLTGTVNSETQHDAAISIARSYAGNRAIVDKITVRQQT